MFVIKEVFMFSKTTEYQSFEQIQQAIHFTWVINVKILLQKQKGNTWNSICIFLPAWIYLFKVNYENTSTMRNIYSMLTIKAPERHWRCSGVFIVNFEHVSHIILEFLLLIFNMLMPAGLVFVWEVSLLILNFCCWPWASKCQPDRHPHF